MKKLTALLVSLSLCIGIGVTSACQAKTDASAPPVQESPLPENGENNGGMDGNTPDNDVQTPVVTGYVYCTGNGVNIRASASTSGTIVGSAYKGDKLSLLQKGDKWHSVLHNGKVAYVSAAYCSSTPVSSQPTATYDPFVLCTGDSVNIRASASTSSTVLGAAKKGKYYALVGQSGNFYKIRYRYGYGYISKSYAKTTQMKKSSNEKIEKVLAAAYETVGTPYVYGATRLHGGKGVLISGFDKHKMDCSSLAQYAMYTGAGICIGMNTATQQSQGALVTGDLQRGDLMFFTSENYVNHALPTKIRHVGIYLGDNYMLHTANTKNNAEIINLSDTGYWWRYFVLARRHF
ncbi:MAG: SH3 domain-containing protein [Clostridia bacterium]|nr:SH3 domain-containing protein [Clostridia bacterium]